MVAAAQRDPAEQQPGMDGMVEPRQAVDRLGHQVPGIEGEHDLVVALDPEFLRQQLEMLGRVFPVDEAVVEPLDMVAQRLELGAFALLALDLDAVDRIAAEELHGGRGDAADIGHDVDRERLRPTLAPAGETERPAPAQPQRLDRDPPAPERTHPQRDRTHGSRRDIEPSWLGRRGVAALLRQDLDRHRPRRTFDRGADAQLPLAADIQARRRIDCQRKPRRPGTEQGIEPDQRQHEQAEIERDRPERLVMDHEADGDRHGRPEEQHGARGRPDHRGTAT